MNTQNTPVNQNHELIAAAVTKVISDADEFGYECDLNAFHLQLMLDCYVNGMEPKLIIDQMKAGGDTQRAFWMVINR
jgi:hypothetical protein